MLFDHSMPAMEAQLRAARSFEELEAALQSIIGLVPTLMAQDVRGHRLFCSALDLAISELPRRLGLPPVAFERGQENVIILATRVYPTGGHSRVIADIARLMGGHRVTVIFTDIYRQVSYRGQLSRREQDQALIPTRSAVILNAPTLVEKIVELHALLNALRPSRIFLLNNHMDPVAVAGAWAFRSVVDYVHHADYMPAIGSSLEFGAHVDLTYTCHLACRRAGLPAIYAGLTIPPPATIDPLAPAASRLRIATCGSLHKYRHPARYKWTDYVAAALATGDSELVHIGPVDDSFIEEIAQALVQAGIDSDRYRAVGPVADLQSELKRQGAQIFLSSYPVSGGKANLEAMAAGLPVLNLVAPELGPLMEDRWPIPQAITVTSPDDLRQRILQADELIAAAREPQARQLVLEQTERFENYVNARPAPPLGDLGTPLPANPLSAG